jgi:hypothetical protein
VTRLHAIRSGDDRPRPLSWQGLGGGRVGLFAGMLLKDDRGIHGPSVSPMRGPTRKACFDAAKSKEEERMARRGNPTDYTGSTLSEDIKSCWGYFDRRIGHTQARP